MNEKRTKYFLMVGKYRSLIYFFIKLYLLHSVYVGKDEPTTPGFLNFTALINKYPVTP